MKKDTKYIVVTVNWFLNESLRLHSSIKSKGLFAQETSSWERYQIKHIWKLICQAALSLGVNNMLSAFQLCWKSAHYNAIFVV